MMRTVVTVVAVMAVLTLDTASAQQAQAQPISKLTSVYKAAKGVEAVAVISDLPTVVQVSPAVQALGKEILLAEDEVSGTRESHALAEYRRAWDIYRESLGDLQQFEARSARVDQPSDVSEFSAALREARIGLAGGAVQTVRDDWIAARAQLLVAHASYLGRPPAPADTVTIDETFDARSSTTSRGLREAGRSALDLRTPKGSPIPVAVRVSGSFSGRTGSPEVVRLSFVTSPAVVAANSSIQLTRGGRTITTSEVKINKAGGWVECSAVEATTGSVPLGGVAFGQPFTLTAAQQRALALFAK
jgi:hypothetical protein